MNPWEKEQEIQEARIWDHYVRDYILDIPFYKNMPITPKVPYIPKVKFDLNFKE